MNKVKNQTSENFLFNFTLNGKINKELASKTIKAKLSLKEIKNKMANMNLI